MFTIIKRIRFFKDLIPYLKLIYILILLIKDNSIENSLGFPNLSVLFFNFQFQLPMTPPKIINPCLVNWTTKTFVI